MKDRNSYTGWRMEDRISLPVGEFQIEGEMSFMAELHCKSCCGAAVYENTPKDNGYRYRVQVGLFRLYNKAMDLQLRLLEAGCMTEIERQGVLFLVTAGDFANLEEAVMLERYFRMAGYNTMVVTI